MLRHARGVLSSATRAAAKHPRNKWRAEYPCCRPNNRRSVIESVIRHCSSARRNARRNSSPVAGIDGDINAAASWRLRCRLRRVGVLTSASAARLSPVLMQARGHQPLMMFRRNKLVEIARRHIVAAAGRAETPLEIGNVSRHHRRLALHQHHRLIIIKARHGLMAAASSSASPVANEASPAAKSPILKCPRPVIAKSANINSAQLARPPKSLQRAASASYHQRRCVGQPTPSPYDASVRLASIAPGIRLGQPRRSAAAEAVASRRNRLKMAR